MIPTDAAATSAAPVKATAVIITDHLDRTNSGTSATSAGTARTPRTPAPSLLTSETLLDQHRVVPADDVAHVDVATIGATAPTTPVSTAAMNTTRLHLRDATTGSVTNTKSVSPTCRSRSNQPMTCPNGASASSGEQ